MQTLKTIMCSMMWVIIVLCVIFVICCLSGCASTSNRTSRTPLDLPYPESVTMLDYNISVYTINDEAKICVNGEGYENMSKNIMELKRYIIQQRTIIESYKKYYENNN